jgi:ADP-ribosylglycohydrolase
MWQAVGDAMGYEFEFQKNPKSMDYVRKYLGDSKIKISDDTQMTYFGLRAIATYLATGAESPSLAQKLIKMEYLNWYHTQLVGRKVPGVPKEMYSYMAPGGATMRSMGEIDLYGVRKPNDARGCGSVMRLLPFVCGILPDDQAEKLARYSGKVTHDSKESDEAVRKLFKYARMLEIHGSAALDVLRTNEPLIAKAKKITELGSGFYAIECVNMALWALLHHSDDPMIMFTVATVHPGDSDSVAAVTGCLYGLMTKSEPTQERWDRVKEGKVLLAQVNEVDSALNIAYN